MARDKDVAQVPAANCKLGDFQIVFSAIMPSPMHYFLFDRSIINNPLELNERHNYVLLKFFVPLCIQFRREIRMSVAILSTLVP